VVHLKGIKIALLSSTGGAVARTVIENSDIKFDLVITDRECGAENIATDLNINLVRINGCSSLELSDDLLRVLKNHNIDYVFVFYTRLLTGELLNEFKDKLINFHPSLLPACPGVDGFGDSVKSGALTIGSTVHYIDQGIDTGSQIMQCHCHVNGRSVTVLRHIIFSQQCASLLQVFNNINENGNVDFKNQHDGDRFPNDGISVATPIFCIEARDLYLSLLK